MIFFLDFCLKLALATGDDIVHGIQTDGVTDVALGQGLQNGGGIFTVVQELHRIGDAVLEEEVHVDEVVVAGDHQTFFRLVLVAVLVIAIG